MQLVPAILTNNSAEARALLEQIKISKKFEKVQIDFIDGKYTNNETIKPDEIDLTPFLVLDFEAHLMVVEESLNEYLKGTERVGYDQIIVQMESVANPGKYKALAVDIHTPITVVEPFLKNLGMVTLMAIEPGFGGQKLDERVWDKITFLSNQRNLRNLKFKIQIDGGVQKEQLEMLEKMGVDEVAVGAKRVLEW